MSTKTIEALESRVRLLERRLAALESASVVDGETEQSRRRRQRRELQDDDHDVMRRFMRGECDLMGRPLA